MADSLTTENIILPLGMPDLPEGAPIDTLLVVSGGALFRADPARLQSAAADTPGPAVTLDAVGTGRVGVPLTLSADATAATGATISKVEFFLGSQLLGQKTSTPYVLVYTPAPADAGPQVVSVKATDSNGKSATARQNVAIGAAADVRNQAPIVSFRTSAASGQVGVALGIIADATDPDGSIARLEFFNFSDLIGSSTTAPYTLQFTPLVAGTHVFSVKATDNQGKSTTTTGKGFTVVAASGQTTPPSFNQTLNAGDNVSTVTMAPGSLGQFKFNTPLSTNPDPNPANMTVFAPGGSTQIGAIDYSGWDTGVVCGYVYNGTLYLLTFTNGNVTLV